MKLNYYNFPLYILRSCSGHIPPNASWRDCYIVIALSCEPFSKYTYSLSATFLLKCISVDNPLVSHFDQLSRRIWSSIQLKSWTSIKSWWRHWKWNLVLTMELGVTWNLHLHRVTSVAQQEVSPHLCCFWSLDLWLEGWTDLKCGEQPYNCNDSRNLNILLERISSSLLYIEFDECLHMRWMSHMCLSLYLVRNSHYFIKV